MDLAEQYSKLSDKELFNIASNDEKWTAEAKKAAYNELRNRNHDEKDIEKSINRRQTLIARSLERTRLQLEKNAVENYTWWDAFGIILLFPFSLILFQNPLAAFVRLEEYGYKRKIWQRIVLIIIAIVFWLALMSTVF